MKITDVFIEIGLDCETGEMGYKVVVHYEEGYSDVFEISFEKVKEIEKMKETLRGKELQIKIEEILGVVESGGERKHKWLP